MRGPPFPRGVRVALGVLALVAAVALFPLRLGLAAAGQTVDARDVHGSVWGGKVNGLAIGKIYLGDVNVAVSPVQLLVGRLRLDIWRKTGQADDISGAWTSGFNQRGVDDVTGTVPVDGALAPLPISTLEMDDVTVHFAGDTCAKAEGRVRARIAGRYAGLNLSQGLSAAPSCDGRAVLLPLVSQSGMERIALRFWRDGRYSAQIAVKGGTDANVAALSGAGLTQSGDDYVLTLEGKL